MFELEDLDLILRKKAGLDMWRVLMVGAFLWCSIVVKHSDDDYCS